jgi:hypothetical protein
MSTQVELDCLSDSFRKEQREYYLQTSQWCDVHPSQLLGPGTAFKSYDLGKVTIEELKVRRRRVLGGALGWGGGAVEVLMLLGGGL